MSVLQFAYKEVCFKKKTDLYLTAFEINKIV